MLDSLIVWSIKNRVLVALMAVLVALLGARALWTTSVDALPDLSDPQVIVYTQVPGQNPRLVEDQVTYPLTTALVSVSGARVVRGYSFFGYSMVYVIFDDGTDPWWARSRVQEFLSTAKKRLPPGVEPVLGPDASGLGWVFQYALESDSLSLPELRSLQDWYLRDQLATVEGVSEVASFGGLVKNVQVRVDPDRMRARGVTLPMVMMALQRSNKEVGGEAIEQGGTEFMIRSKGRLSTLDDVAGIPVMAPMGSLSPVLVRDIADVGWGPEMRRGVADLDGEGDVAGGVVVMRQGENALAVIDGVKRKLEELKKGLPHGVTLRTTYDRTGLIDRAIDTLSHKLFEEMAIVALVCALFLMHLRSALVAVITLPIALLMAFLAMRMQGMNANIMSLGGLAIAIGAMVDAAIILVENAHKHLEHEQSLPESERRPHWDVVRDAAREVGPALFWSLLLITVSFLPVFSLTGQEGRLFKPLAFTKTYAMAGAAFLSVTLVPVLMGWFLKGRIPSEERNPLNRFLVRVYHPVARAVLARPYAVILAAVAIVAVTVFPLKRLGSEFMPPLWEGDLLYMPTTLPGISVGQAADLLRRTDSLIRTVPEVEQVHGKAGRAETATDPAGLDMFETVIRLKDPSQWRPGFTREDIVASLDSTVKIPGVTNAWTMPIKARIDMLSTGIKTPVGVKIAGPDLAVLDSLGRAVESALREVPGTASAFAERSTGGNYLQVDIDRPAASRAGIQVDDIQQTIETGVAGMPVTTWIDGPARYGVTLRFARDFREDLDGLKRIPVASSSGLQVPLGELATFTWTKGPMVIRTEDTRANTWVFVDTREGDLGGYIARAQSALEAKVHAPAGYTIVWSGEFESMQRARKTLMVVVPLTLLLIVVILFLNTKSLMRTMIVMLAVPFSLVGAVWFLWFLGFHLSVAVWVGLIALAGLDAETGVVMLLYLDHAFDKRKLAGTLRSWRDLREAIDEGAVQRVRPKVMTASVILAGLLPILWSDGAGADVMKRIAAPMVGGVVTSVVMELLVYPALYYVWRRRELPEAPAAIS